MVYVCSVAGAAAFVGVLTLSHPYSVSGLSMMVERILKAGLVLSLCLYAVNLPYMLLMFRSPFFRQRFTSGLALPLNPDARSHPQVRVVWSLT